MFNFVAATYHTISDIEILWTLLASVGLFFSAWNVREAHIDLQVLRESKVRNGRRKIAWYGFIAEIFRSIIQFVFVALGVLAMTVPDRNYEGEPWNIILLGVVFRWGLILAAALIMVKSYLAWNLRRELRSTRGAELNDGVTTTEVTGQLTVMPDENGTTVQATLEGHDTNV